jgi:ornithine decarboxylase
MKVTNLDERIHVLDNEANVMTVIKDIAMSGLQEEAFYVLDIGDIVRKHQIWKEKLPRVEPYYGEFSKIGELMLHDNMNMIIHRKFISSCKM